MERRKPLTGRPKEYWAGADLNGIDLMYRPNVTGAKIERRAPDFSPEGFFTPNMSDAEDQSRTDTRLSPPVFEFGAIRTNTFFWCCCFG